MVGFVVKLVFSVLLLVLGRVAYYSYKNIGYQREADGLMKGVKSGRRPDSRQSIIEKLMTVNFDICIIGGGSTGVGCALDAAARGLKVALVEAKDFSSGTSSKSTKLLHGGVRYLDKALKYFDVSQILLVGDALHERATVMKIAPYLSKTVPFMLPIYNRVHIVYYWIALKIYDWLSTPHSLGRSFFINAKESKMRFNNLKRSNLIGSMVYYDGVMDDARINVMLAVTAHYHGAVVANHVKLSGFVKDGCKVLKATCFDQISEREFSISSKCFISATGSFTDIIREKVTPKPHIMIHSTGTHIAVRPLFGPENMGLVDSETDDKRMLFLVPWKGVVIAGSTEVKRELVESPVPTNADIEFLKHEVQKYNDQAIYAEDVLSAWTGIRPLVREEPSDGSTESIVRKFKLIDDGNNLISITGGKWTTFRLMAENAIDMAVQNYKLQPARGCLTDHLSIDGSCGYSIDLYHTIKSQLRVSLEYAKHLQDHYGANALKLKTYLSRYPGRISDKYHFRAAEVVYVVENEFAMTINDVVNNRFRIGFFDVLEASNVGVKVGKILKKHFGWSKERMQAEVEKLEMDLEALGYKIIKNRANK